jgi:hypothetical protein
VAATRSRPPRLRTAQLRLRTRPPRRLTPRHRQTTVLPHPAALATRLRSTRPLRHSIAQPRRNTLRRRQHTHQPVPSMAVQELAIPQPRPATARHPPCTARPARPRMVHTLQLLRLLDRARRVLSTAQPVRSTPQRKSY